MAVERVKEYAETPTEVGTGAENRADYRLAPSQ